MDTIITLLPGKHPRSAFQGVSVAASFESYILGKCPCKP